MDYSSSQSIEMILIGWKMPRSLFALLLFASLVVTTGCVVEEQAVPVVEKIAPVVVPGDVYPSVMIRSGELQAKVYLPDTEQGYYRGTRFDWSSMIGPVRLGERTFFCELKRPHKPTIHDHGIGPCEEFGMNITVPVGHDEAKPGETFIKIGVGLLERIDDKKYFFNKPYRIREAFPWKVTTADDRVIFKQVCADLRGWGYEYTKIISIDGATATLTIEHVLVNTGTKAFATDHYSHNMLLIDNRGATSGYTLTFPAPVVTEQKEKLEKRGVVFEGNEIRYEDLRKGAAWCQLQGFDKVEHNKVTLLDEVTGATVTIKGDWPAKEYNVYTEPAGVCPEPFFYTELEPGHEARWTTRYFFTVGES